MLTILTNKTKLIMIFFCKELIMIIKYVTNNKLLIVIYIL